MTTEERLVKYENAIEDKTKMRNQILVRNGQGVLCLDGKGYKCKVEGYAKMTNDEYVELIPANDIGICILPKQRLLVNRNGEWFAGGYKKENSSDCFLLLHAVSEYDEVFIMWISETDIPICIMRGDSEMEDTSIGSIMLKVFKYLMFNRNFAKFAVRSTDASAEKGDVDEFE